MNKKIVSIICIIGIISIVVDPLYATSTVWSWVKDMYNQPNIKPYEEGSMQNFPVGSVTTEGVEISSNGIKHQIEGDLSWLASRNNEALAPKNPIPFTTSSINNGKYLYDVNCTVCHGGDGNAQTVVAKLRGVPPIAPILAAAPLTDGYLYYRITYGGINVVLMPPFGYSTLAKERWDIVNYLQYKWGKKTIQ